MRRGSRNTYVLILQDALNALGYTTNTLDGIFGHATENALKACQRAVRPDCRRRMRLRQLEKDRRGDGGDRQNGDGY